MGEVLTDRVARLATGLSESWRNLDEVLGERMSQDALDGCDGALPWHEQA